MGNRSYRWTGWTLSSSKFDYQTGGWFDAGITRAYSGMRDGQTFSSPSQGGKGKEFLGIHFVKCGTYGRIYKNQLGTAYTGHCPRCMHPIRVRIGPSGTGKRFFKCFCP